MKLFFSTLFLKELKWSMEDVVLEAFSRSEKLRVKACEPYLLCPGPLDVGEKKGKALTSCKGAGQRERFRDLGHEGPLGLFGPQFFLLAWKSLSFPGLRVIVTCFSESQRSWLKW